LAITLQEKCNKKHLVKVRNQSKTFLAHTTRHEQMGLGFGQETSGHDVEQMTRQDGQQPTDDVLQTTTEYR
jgi:hypothetical protein